MNRAIYSTLLRLAAPLLLLWMAQRAWKAGGRWQVFGANRFGVYAQAAPPAAIDVWVHAVSLGETRAAQPLVRALLDQGRRVLFTHMTATGMAEGARLFGRDLEQGRLQQQWLPYDFPGACRRFFAHYGPRVGVLIEREVWPNLLAAAQAAQVPMVLASARLSAAAAQRSTRSGALMRAAYRNITLACAQTPDDAQRLRAAGVRHVRVAGNFKFDVTPDTAQLNQGRALAAALHAPVVALASTREEENLLFVQALQQLRSHFVLERQSLADTALFFLIPRHPQRFDAVAALLKDADLPFVRWSQCRDLPAAAAAQACRGALVVLGDSTGDMMRHYACAQVAIVGGSFAPYGGQNLIEACSVGTPVIVGPHTWNFEQAAHDAITLGAAARADDVRTALDLALAWLGQAETRHVMAQAARAWTAQHTGAVARVLAAIEELAPGRRQD